MTATKKVKQHNSYKFPDEIGALVAYLIELRSRADHAEEYFIGALAALEETDRWQIHAGGDGTFITFLSRFNICDAKRFAAGKKALEVIPAVDIKTIGMPAAKQVARKLETPRARQEAIRRLSNSAAQSGGTVPERTAARIVNETKRDYEPPQAAVAVSLVDKLRRDVAEREEEIRALKVRVKDLERENRELRERLGDEEIPGTARKSRSGIKTASPRKRRGPSKAA